LKTLRLVFNPTYREFEAWDLRISGRYGPRKMILERYYSHQWDIFGAIGNSQYPLPRLRSLTILRWMVNFNTNSVYEAPMIPELAASLQHLRFSLHRGSRHDCSKEHMHFWNQIVVPRILQPAINLESLKISRETHETLDISELPTYPRLAALSLSTISWEEGMISQGDNITRFPVEDLIVRHRTTLKKLKLYNCVIGVEKRTETPFRSWADVYDRLAEELTELVELVVLLEDDGYGIEYYVPPADEDDHRRLRSEWAERDTLALERFNAVVENRKMDAGSGSQQ
jgi:hypothetical protein